MPNHVVNELIFRDLSEEVLDAILSATCGPEGVDFSILVPMPLNVWQGNVGTKHEKAFRLDGMTWARDNWGTKWNAYKLRSPEREPGGLILRFDTAWAPPYPWLAAVFNKFKVSFDHNWLDEGAERGVQGVFDYAKMEALGGDPWSETPASEEMHRHFHKLRWGVEQFEDEE